MRIVLFHSACGPRPATRAAAGRLRAAGHEVVVPDLYDGRTTESVEAGLKIRDEIGAETLQRRAAEAVAPYAGERLAYAGFSLGASLAQRLALANGGAAGLLLMHGTAEVTGDAAGLPVQLHVADPDEFEPADWLAEWEESMRGAGAHPEIFRYPGAGHLFTDPDLPGHDERATTAAWERALAFLQAL